MASIIGLAFGGGVTWDLGHIRGIVGVVGAYLTGGGALGFLFCQLHSIWHMLHVNNKLLLLLQQNPHSNAYHVELGPPPSTPLQGVLFRINGTDE